MSYRSAYASADTYGLYRNVHAKGMAQSEEQRAASEASLERISQAIMAGRTHEPRPFKDAAERAASEKLAAFYEAEIAAGRKSCAMYLRPLREQLDAFPAAPALPNAIEIEEQLVPELEEAPEGLDEYRVAQEIADYCASVREEVFRKTINEALKKHGWRVVRLPGWRVVRLPGWRTKQYGWGD